MPLSLFFGMMVCSPKTAVDWREGAIGRGEFLDHGLIVYPASWRIFFIEGMKIGAGGHIYPLARAEMIEASRTISVK